MKTNMRQKVELLAPAGNIEGFYGAIHAGADAVYLGGDKFGARAYADNFTTEELVACIRYAHIHGRRVYLTVNTLVKEKEWDQLYDYILPYYQAGLDGVIIQDLGVFLYLKEHFPGMELHISTQMTLTGSFGASYMKELGACRIVPARELSLEEIKKIKADTGLEIEAFIHGAMCYCYSGQCLFSSILGGRSGNRGRCAQPCRLPYTVEKDGCTSGECYPLSLKDMCTVEHIPELIQAGIDSFKIEGRMKKPEYAAGVTAIYRRVIDRYYSNAQKWKVTPAELKELSGLYIRSERQDGYYHKHNGADMVTLHSPAYSGSDEVLLQRIRKEYIETKPKMTLNIYGHFAAGEPASVTLVYQDHSVTVTGDVVQIAQKQPVTRENIEKQLNKLGDTVFEADDIWVEVEDHIFYPLKAINELRRQAVTALEEQLIEAHGLCSHREAAPTDPVMKENRCDRPVEAHKASNKLTISVTTQKQLDAAIRFLKKDSQMVSRLYVEGDLLVGQEKNESIDTQLTELLECTHRQGQNPEIFLILPYIIRKRDEWYLKELLIRLGNDHLYSGCMVRSLEGYAWLKENHYSGKIAADSGFYIWNRETLGYWKDKLDSICLPWELNGTEQRGLAEGATNDLGIEKIIYGHVPMMITANCVIRTTDQCVKQKKFPVSSQSSDGKVAAKGNYDADGEMAVLTDRYHKKFPVAANCRHCMNVIYNSVPLSLHGSCMKWKDSVSMRLHFTIEDAHQTLAVMNYFEQLIKGEQPKLPYAEYTTGHEKRGVE